MHTLATIGYESATVASFLDSLTKEGVDLLVDVRAVASSRRPGFAKTKLAANLREAGIDYLHLRGLGTPADGRAAARAGRHEEMRQIFMGQLRTPAAEVDLETLAGLVRSRKRVAIMCLEADPTHCHRTLVAEALARVLPLRIRNLMPGEEAED